ncbi:putative basic amino acid antiporter YfcC [Enterovibrio paralichthyis]|uniref:putative basic amino acid antiporter YfcC n=1 Tax=Enterovibrio paralichthyis TaxID=2853805 RepID=UPI003AB93AB8
MSQTHVETQEGVSRPSKWQMPDTLILIFFVGLFAAAMTYLIPVGQFDSQQVTFMVDGAEKTRTVINPESFRLVTDENGDTVYNPVKFFASGGGIGLMNFPFEGLVSGSKWGSAIGVIMFMLIIGGAFGIVMRTGTIDNGILKLIDKTKGSEALFIPVLFLLFSLGGAVFGMGEEAVAFAIIIAPLMVRLGYDGITTVMVTYVATQVGFATSWMNPFSVAIAQGIAGVPVLSGMTFRMVMWAGFTLVGIAFTMMYAAKIKANPKASYSFQSDAYLKNKSQEETESRWGLGDTLVILTVLATTVWVVWGVVAHAWYIPEIASQFFTMGFVVAIIAVIFKLNDMTMNDVASSFKEGAGIMLAPALLVGCAKGVLLMLGGGSEEASVLNTILHNAGSTISALPSAVAAWLMYVFQSVFNFFVTSGSGQAALTMPLLAPLSDIAGISRQVAVLAFQLGDGFTNIIVPTSASLMATLGVCRIDWGNWAKFVWRFMVLLFIIASVVVVGAHLTDFA